MQRTEISLYGQTILFVGPLPPPITGMAAVNVQMVELIRHHAKVVVQDTLPKSRRRSFGYTLTKGWLVVSAMMRALTHRLRGGRLLYASVDDGWGMLGNIAFVAAARIGGLKIVLHHHSYKYIHTKSGLMKALVGIGGKSTLHVMLCREMGEEFAGLYGETARFTVMPNVVEAMGSGSESASTGPRRMGLLSNLTFQKGLAEFVRLFEAISKESEVEAVLAGPVVGDEERRFIDQKVAASDGRLTWIGPVYGDDKASFFSSIDVFVFPTKTEAFGLVLMEALYHGTPVITVERGCMCLMKSIDGTHMISPDENFHDWAMPILRRMIATDRRTAAANRERRAAMARDLNEQWTQERGRVLQDIIGGK